MKLRLNGNSLRLRLTRPEVTQLREAGAVEQSVDFGLGTVLTYRIQSRDVTDPMHAVFCNRTDYRPSSSRVSRDLGWRGRSWALCAARRFEDSGRKGFPLPDPQAGRSGTRCLSPSRRINLSTEQEESHANCDWRKARK